MLKTIMDNVKRENVTNAEKLRKKAEIKIQDMVDYYIDSIEEYLDVAVEQGHLYCAYPLSASLEHFERLDKVLDHFKKKLNLRVSPIEMVDPINTSIKNRFLMISW